MTEFARRLDACFERRFGVAPRTTPGRPARDRAVPTSTRHWLAKVAGVRPHTVASWRCHQRHPPSYAWAVLRLLEERQELRERLAAALRENRGLQRGADVASRLLARRNGVGPHGIRARPLYAPRESELDQIMEEEWHRTGVLR